MTVHVSALLVVAITALSSLGGLIGGLVAFNRYVVVPLGRIIADLRAVAELLPGLRADLKAVAKAIHRLQEA